jgi:hypothetical protein
MESPGTDQPGQDGKLFSVRIQERLFDGAIGEGTHV